MVLGEGGKRVKRWEEDGWMDGWTYIQFATQAKTWMYEARAFRVALLRRAANHPTRQFPFLARRGGRGRTGVFFHVNLFCTFLVRRFLFI